MIIDDYANPDTPDVTRAVNLFLEMQGGIASVDESVRWFKNKGKHIPVCSKVIYVFKAYEKIVNIDSNITKRYIWGTGKVAAEFLERCGAKIKFDGVLDNYRTGMGKWNELPFCEVNQISKENSIIVIATNLYYYDEIKEQLIEWGFQEGVNFIRYSLYEVYYVNSWYE